MENSEEIKINETHICTLKKHDNKIYVENESLVFKFESSFREFIRMSENPNRQAYELENFITKGPLQVLLEIFNFCKYLDKPYEGLDRYAVIGYQEYTSREKKHRANLLKKIKDESSEDKMREFQENEKKKLIKEITYRKIAHSINEAYEKFEDDNDILAFSHRRRGFDLPEFKLGDDFDVIYKSNFGYGSVSYFYSHIKYKDIDILPYSDWIRYRFANKHDIIRFTRRHQLLNPSWLEAFDFTSKLFNHSVTDPKTFVNVWIINECKEMIEGLEYLLNKNEKHELIHSQFGHDVSVEINAGKDLLDFKGEKISGALHFMSKIKELTVFTDKINSFIERIKQCNLSIYPQLKEEIAELKSTIDDLNKQIETKRPTLEKLTNQMVKYDKIKLDIVKFLNSQNNSDLNINSDDVISELKRQYPEYEATSNEYEKAQKEFNALQKELAECTEIKEKFEGYVQIIKEQLNLEKEEQIVTG